MPKLPFSSSIRLTLSAASVSALLLSGCTTTKETAETGISQPEATRLTSAKGIVAKGGTTASNRYIDPVISKASGKQQTQAPVAAVPPASLDESAFPAAPTAPQPSSIAGLATQPTAIRAGSGTIFSTSSPASTPSTSPSANGPVPAELPRRNFNATNASLFGLQPAVPAAACGTDPEGNPLTC